MKKSRTRRWLVRPATSLPPPGTPDASSAQTAFNNERTQKDEKRSRNADPLKGDGS